MYKIQINTSTNHKECTPGARRLHKNKVKLLKEKLKIYETDPFCTERLEIATGKELPEKVVENLIKAGEIGDGTYLLFVNECLIKGKTDLFDTIKKVDQDIGLKKTKKKWKAASVMKEDR